MKNNETAEAQLSLSEVKQILNNIGFFPSGIQMSEDGPTEFEAKETEDGFMIRCSFWRPDTNTGEMGQGFGRWNFTPKNSTEKSIVMTAWVAWKLILEHEALEAFNYKGKRLFNPHKSLNELAYPEKID